MKHICAFLVGLNLAQPILWTLGLDVGLGFAIFSIPFAFFFKGAYEDELRREN